MNLKLYLRLGFRFWLRLDLPYVPVWPGMSQFQQAEAHQDIFKKYDATGQTNEPCSPEHRA